MKGKYTFRMSHERDLNMHCEGWYSMQEHILPSWLAVAQSRGYILGDMEKGLVWKIYR